MEIQINGHPVEFTLEKEKNVKEVVTAISQWARERELILSEVRVGDEVFSMHDVPERAIENVQSMNCIIQSKADLVADSICEATEYCGRILSRLDGPQKGELLSGDDIGKIATGLDWLLEIAAKTLSLLGISARDAKYRDKKASELFDEIGRLRKALAGNEEDAPSILSRHKNLLADFRDFLRIVLLSDEMRRTIITSIDSPDTVAEMLTHILNEIPQQKQNLENAAAAYQAGKDTEGSSGVEKFIDFIYRYFRVCHQIKPVFNIDPANVSSGDLALNEKNDAINELLNQMIQSLENNDIIGLTDVLEYELVPALNDIEELCKTVFAMIQASKEL